MQDGTCEGCVYAFPTVTDDMNVTTKCRRYPPALFVLDGEVTQSFPDAVNRCGEYKTEKLPLLLSQPDPEL